MRLQNHDNDDQKNTTEEKKLKENQKKNSEENGKGNRKTNYEKIIQTQAYQLIKYKVVCRQKIKNWPLKTSK